jgi:hypothetical protein
LLFNKPGKEIRGIMMIKELASVNLFLIFMLIIIGFGIIKTVKKRFED